MVGRAAHRETGDRRPVASSRLSPLLALAIAAPHRPAKDQRGDADLRKDAPNRRAVEPKPAAHATVISMARAGGLHHRYSWRNAA
jgi:hypothetical protein